MRVKKGSRVISRILKLVLLDTWWYHFPWSQDQLKRSESGQGNVGFGFEHTIFEALMSWPRGDGQWQVDSLVFREGGRSRMVRLESHQHLVSNWTHGTGWGLPRRSLVCLKGNRSEVLCAGLGLWNSSKWDTVLRGCIDGLPYHLLEVKH